MSFFSLNELKAIGFKKIGKSVQLSKKASIYNPGNIEIDDYSRIDDFCILSAGIGGIKIGRNVHLAVYTSLIGSASIHIDDFASVSSRVAVYSSNDDYSGKFMTNPTVAAEFTNVNNAPVIISRHVIVGAGSVILPGVTLDEGSAIGALSLVRNDCEAFGVYAGTPAKKIADRQKDLLQLEKVFRNKFPE